MIKIPRFEHEYTLTDLLFSIKNNNSLCKNENMSNYFGTEYLFFTNYARTGLRLLLESMSNKGLTRVGIQPFTCPTVFEAIKSAGCTFSFVDIDKSYTIDINDLQNKIDSIDILIITHTFGFPAKINKILEIAKDKYIIEDCAHAFLSKYKGNSVGIFGDAAIFSSGYGKFPSIGPGGYVIINKESLALAFYELYNKLEQVNKYMEINKAIESFIYSIAYKQGIYGLITFPILKKLDKKFDFIGKNNFTELKGYIGNVNLFNKNFKKYNSMLHKKKANVKLFFEELPFAKPKINKFSDPNYYVVPMLHTNRDKVVECLLNNGIESGKHFSESINYAREYGYVGGHCPNSEIISKAIYTIPLHSYLTLKEVRRMASFLKVF